MACRAAGPHTALRDGIYLLGRFLPRSRYTRQELTIAIFNGTLGNAVKFGTEAVQDIGFAGQWRRLHTVRIDAYFRKPCLSAWDHAEDANRSRNRCRIGKNDVCGKRYPITAARGQIRHRNDDWNLFRLGSLNGQPDFFRCGD